MPASSKKHVKLAKFAKRPRPPYVILNPLSGFSLTLQLFNDNSSITLRAQPRIVIASPINIENWLLL